MEYLQSLSTYLTANGVKNLESWAEDGELHFSPTTPEGGFETKYSANFEISVTEIEPKRLFMLVVSWIHAFNSERESQNLPPPQFFSERLDGKNYDIGFKIDFIEQFSLLEAPNGAWIVNGKRVNVVSNFQEAMRNDDSSYSDLLIVDSHTQDNGLKK